jgi:hypothetical protein
VIPVGISSKYRLSLNPPHHNMVQGASGIYPRSPWHDPVNTNILFQCQVNKLTASPFMIYHPIIAPDLLAAWAAAGTGWCRKVG